MDVCIESFQHVASDYQALYESLFDADLDTLNNVLMYSNNRQQVTISRLNHLIPFLLDSDTAVY